jgi:hypothetical protein
MDDIQTCSWILARIVGVLVAAGPLIFFLVMAQARSRKWLFGLILVPIIFGAVTFVAAAVFTVMTVATIGLPLLFCQPFL